MPVSTGSVDFIFLAHADQEQIEREFVAWHSPATIAKEYGLADRSSIHSGQTQIRVADKTPGIRVATSPHIAVANSIFTSAKSRRIKRRGNAKMPLYGKVPLSTISE